MMATILMTSLVAGVMSLAGPADTPPRAHLELASADCNAAAQRVVARTKGQLLSVSAEQQGGKTVCKVTVLVPSSGDKRPRKMTVSVSE